MPKLSSVCVLAAAATLVAASFSSAPAASFNTNVSVGRINTGHFSGGSVTPRVHDSGPKFKPKPKPQTDQGGCHTVKNSIIRCYDGA